MGSCAQDVHCSLSALKNVDRSRRRLGKTCSSSQKCFCTPCQDHHCCNWLWLWHSGELFKVTQASTLYLTCSCQHCAPSRLPSRTFRHSRRTSVPIRCIRQEHTRGLVSLDANTSTTTLVSNLPWWQHNVMVLFEQRGQNALETKELPQRLLRPSSLSFTQPCKILQMCACKLVAVLSGFRVEP